MKFEAIFFDNDGLLVDTESIYLVATREILATVGVEISTDWYKRALETGASSVDLALQKGITKEEIEVLRHRRNVRYSAMLQEGLDPIDGVVEALEALHGKIFMAIVTNSRKDHFDIIMEKTGLLKYFDLVVTTNDVPRPKPFPDPYLYALSLSGKSAERSLAVEDSGRGMASAKAAGLTCFAVPDELTKGHDFSMADKVLNGIRELPALVL